MAHGQGMGRDYEPSPPQAVAKAGRRFGLRIGEQNLSATTRPPLYAQTVPPIWGNLFSRKVPPERGREKKWMGWTIRRTMATKEHAEASYKLQAASLKPQAASFEPRATSHEHPESRIEHPPSRGFGGQVRVHPRSSAVMPSCCPPLRVFLCVLCVSVVILPSSICVHPCSSVVPILHSSNQLAAMLAMAES